MQSHVFWLALFTLIQPQLPCPLTFPTYYPRDLKGISKSPRACKSFLAARAHSSVLKYLGDSSARASWRLESARVRSSQGLTRLEPSSPGVPRAGSCPTLFCMRLLNELTLGEIRMPRSAQRLPRNVRYRRGLSSFQRKHYKRFFVLSS